MSVRCGSVDWNNRLDFGEQLRDQWLAARTSPPRRKFATRSGRVRLRRYRLSHSASGSSRPLSATIYGRALEFSRGQERFCSPVILSGRKSADRHIAESLANIKA